MCEPITFNQGPEHRGELGVSGRFARMWHHDNVPWLHFENLRLTLFNFPHLLINFSPLLTRISLHRLAEGNCELTDGFWCELIPVKPSFPWLCLPLQVLAFLSNGFQPPRGNWSWLALRMPIFRDYMNDDYLASHKRTTEKILRAPGRSPHKKVQYSERSCPSLKNADV